MGLDGRLLNASRWSYAVTGSAADTPSLVPYAAGSALVAPVACLATGSSRIDAAMVGTGPDGVVLVFRGTLPPLRTPDHLQTLKDWLQDAELGLVAGDKLPGRVHHGFLGALDTLWDGLVPALQRALAASPVKRVLVTGHSKGGAVAHLAAARLALTSVVHGSDLVVRTFEGAHPGNPAFSQAYARLVPDVIRYEYRDDLVPHLPLSFTMRRLFREEIARLDLFDGVVGIDLPDFDYAAAGTLRYIDGAGAVHDGSSALLSARRFASLAERIATADWAGIVHDHSIDSGTATFEVVTARNP